MCERKPACGFSVKREGWIERRSGKHSGQLGAPCSCQSRLNMKGQRGTDMEKKNILPIDKDDPEVIKKEDMAQTLEMTGEQSEESEEESGQSISLVKEK
ncbi:MAG: hypothetical protein K5629_05350 [Eubacteriales bacterium]|nr:hypothetical protein [Eubacteriales bacterium]